MARVVHAFVLALMLGTGCAAHKDWKLGQAYEAKGEDWKASQ